MHVGLVHSLHLLFIMCSNDFYFLFKATLTQNTVITDNGGFGNRMKAIDVVAAVLNGLKEQLFCELRKDVKFVVAVNAIHWTLTVPAIWTKGGRQFMIDAAKKVYLKIIL